MGSNWGIEVSGTNGEGLSRKDFPGKAFAARKLRVRVKVITAHGVSHAGSQGHGIPQGNVGGWIHRWSRGNVGSSPEVVPGGMWGAWAREGPNRAREVFKNYPEGREWQDNNFSPSRSWRDGEKYPYDIVAVFYSLF